jgi:hypothetical protein
MPPRQVDVTPQKYTGSRKDEYNALKRVFGRIADIPNDLIRRLNTNENRSKKEKEKRSLKREQELRRQIATEIAERERKEEERRIKRNEKARERRAKQKEQKKEIKAFNNNLVIDRSFTSEQYADDQGMYDAEIIEALGKLKLGDNVYYQITVNGETFANGLLEITSNVAETIFWDTVAPLYQRYENGEWVNHFIRDGGDRIRFVITKADTIPSERVQQRYRDSVEGFCGIEPLVKLWREYENNSESDASKTRCRQIANRLEKMKERFPNGVPEEEMEEVARAAHRCIVIYDILNAEMVRYNKKSNKVFSFKNTRKDHLETNRGELIQNNSYTRVTHTELDKIIEEHKADDVFYHYEGDFKNGEARAISSIRGMWAVYHEDYDIFNEFSKSIGIKNYGLNAVKHSELNQFIKESRIINSAPVALCDEPNNIDGCHTIDLTKAYTQHKMTKYYAGFLGHIQQYRKFDGMFNRADRKFIETHLGVYQVRVLKNPNSLLVKLGIKVHQKYTLPSPEILYMMDKGVEVDVLGGCWGSKFDFDYSSELVDDYEVEGEIVKNRRYCTWAGKLGTDKALKTYTFPGNKEWASHLKYTLGDDKVMYFADAGMIVVKVPKKMYKTTHHVLSFITSYTRLNMLSIMEGMEDRLVKVILDGIYFRGDIPEVDIPHKVDKDMKVHNFRDYWYYPAEVSVSSWTLYNRELDGSCVLAGQGGTGKSYSVLMDTGIIDPLYVVPMHNLGQKAKAAYGCTYTTINKLIGADTVKDGKVTKCRSYKETETMPGVIFIDELTMIEESWVKKAIELYPDAMIYLAGDIDGEKWFQTRNGKPGMFSKIYIPKDWRYVYYKNDRRSRDNELKEMKLKVREIMNSVFRDGGNLDAQRVSHAVKQLYKPVKFDDACGMFTLGDTWIAGTHKTSDKLLEKGILSGYINGHNEVCGKDDMGAKPRGAFTIHSFQGTTIESGKIFISLDCFEYAMLYTAVSRAVNFSQIVLVN